MKNLFFIVALAWTGLLQAQELRTSSWNHSTSQELVPFHTFYENGAVHTSSFKVNGVLEGRFIEFNTTGQVLTSGVYASGRKIGTWVVLSADGKSFYELAYTGSRISSTKEWTMADAR